MGIREKENELFEKWSASRKGFVADGVVDEESYLNSSPKIMFVLKEVNDPDGGNWDLREFLRDGAKLRKRDSSPTFDNITRWIVGIQSTEREINWEEIERVTNNQRKRYLRSICAINLKKLPGGHTTDNDALSQIVKEDKDFIYKQFEIYHPDLVICCGSIVSELLHKVVKLPQMSEPKETTRGIRYHEYEIRKHIVSYSHPAARVADCLLYYGLIDAVKEILSTK